MTRFSPRRSRRQAGFSLLEVILVLGIAAAIVAAILMVYGKYQDTARANMDVDDVRSLFSAADSYYKNQSSYTGVSMAVLNTANALPGRLENQPTYTNVWGGTFNMGSASSVSGSGDLLVLTSDGLPMVACERLIAVLAPEMYDTSVNGSVVPLAPAKDLNGWERYYTDQARATSLCSGNNNILVFRQLKAPVMWAYRMPPYANSMQPGEAALVNAEATRYQNAMNAREAVQVGLP